MSFSDQHKFSSTVLLTGFAATLLIGCSAAKQADQALYQVTEAVSERDTVTGQRTISIADREQQIKSGDAQAQKHIDQLRANDVPLNEAARSQQYARMQQIFDRVHNVTHLRNEDWTPVLVGVDRFNAYVMGGTYMFVFQGLMEDLTDDQVAAVFGHEIAHVSANHVGERMSHMKIGAISGSDSVEDQGFAAAYTHQQELEADRIGILYSALAGYDPHAAAQIWRDKFKQRGNLREVGRYHDHPVDSERSETADKVADAASQHYIPGQINPDFERLLANNAVYETKSANYEDEAGEGGGLAALFETATDAYLRHQNAKVEKERQERRARFVRSVEQSIEIVGYRATGAHDWELGLRYGGEVPLNWITVRGALPNNKGERLDFLQKIDGPIYPGNVFSVSFSHPQLPASRIEPRNGRFAVDDAEPYE